MDEPHICGRCGYDLSGVVESWWEGTEPRPGAACPLAGVCSECGLELAWADVFNAWRLDRPWLAEHARTKRAFLWRVPSTLWRVLLPWVFWRDLSMLARVRPWIALLAVLLVFLPLHVGVNGWRTYQSMSQDYAYSKSYALQHGRLLGPIGLGSVGPIAGAVFGGPVVQPDVWFRGPLPPRLRAGGSNSPPPTIRVPSIVYTRITYPAIPWWFVGAVTMQAMWLVLLAFLPATRAVCRVRWAHVWRAVIWSGGVLLIGFAVFRLTGITPRPGSRIYGAASAFEWVAFIALGAWVTAWWCCTVRIGWGLRHGQAVAWLLSLAAWLAGLAAGAIYDPYLLSSLI